MSGELTFPLSEANADGRGIARVAHGVMVVAGAVLLLAAAYSTQADPHWWSPSGPGTIVGVAILGLGLVVIPTIARLLTNRVVSLEIDDRGVRMRYQRGSIRDFSWRDATLHGSLMRMGRATPDGTDAGISWYLSLRNTRFRAEEWITTEAAHALVTRFERVGVRATWNSPQSAGPGTASGFASARFDGIDPARSSSSEA